ncbi:hypothetical protein PHMEG_0008772 [Phytophthora megakarya]|uniref:Uncharacterized protein n=1 Tax=Phytophthora megakarya TaxID=4795 RepID=A0A225WJJ4_9STRA|nr:hypothetical protein PHMEG_0008772 [Phytophthora megakarya]
MSSWWGSKHEDVVTAVTTLMTALRAVKNHAELRRHTQLAPLRASTTRWGSTFTMLERYVRISDAIKRVGAIYDLIPKPATCRRTPISSIHPHSRVPWLSSTIQPSGEGHTTDKQPLRETLLTVQAGDDLFKARKLTDEHGECGGLLLSWKALE